MFSNFDFRFDNISSKDMDAVIVNMDSSQESNFGIIQSVIEDKISGRDIPYFYGIDRQTYTIPITITKTDGNGQLMRLDYESRKKLVHWLVKDTYKEFKSDDYPDQVFFIIFTEGKSYQFCNDEGYLTLTARLNSPYSYQEKVTTTKNYSTSVSNIIYMNNLSNVIDKYKPELEFTLIGDATNITITNLTTNKSLIFTGLSKGETIYVNNQTGKIISSLGTTRLDKCNRNWLSLDYGENKMLIVTNLGGCKIKFITQFPMAF